MSEPIRARYIVEADVYGGTVEDGADALEDFKGTFDLPNGGEVEIISVFVDDDHGYPHG